MKRAKVLTVLLMIALFTFSCSDDDDKKTTGPGGGGGSLAEHEGDNAVVTEDNVSQVIAEVNELAWDVLNNLGFSVWKAMASARHVAAHAIRYAQDGLLTR